MQVNDLFCALLSEWVYNPVELTPPFTEDVKLTYIESDNDDAVILHENEKIVICFRGTDDFKDVLEDIDVDPDHYADIGKCHSGFAEAYFSLSGQIHEYLRNNYDVGTKIYLTGHSKGGAMATICLMDLKSRDYGIMALYTFGSPKVAFGNEFLNRFHAYDIPYFRYVNAGDGVTKLPRNYMGYYHVGLEIALKGSWWEYAYITRFFSHPIKFYIKRIKKRQNSL